MNDRTKTAVVTGANGGLGFETAAQLPDAGYTQIVVSARTAAKADRAVVDLRKRVGRDVFHPLTLDLDDLVSAAEAADSVIERFGTVDALILNAGVPGLAELTHTSDGFEETIAATLIGHHVFTMRLVDAEALAPGARIVIAGSEAARNELPTYPFFQTFDMHDLAKKDHAGDLGNAIEAVIRMGPSMKYGPNRQYATAKMFVAWWAAELSGRLPEGATANAVSPGNTSGTEIASKLPAVMRVVMMPMMKLMPGMSHPVEAGARRYVDATEMGPGASGQFYASKPKRMTGPLARMGMHHLHDPKGQAALWDVLERITDRSILPPALTDETL